MTADPRCDPNRRPIAARDTGWARAAARRLALAGVSPNAISRASIAAAAVAGAAFWASGAAEGGARAALLLLAAAAILARLLANLFDGMVAVEAGRGAPDGPFWNEFPDRVADMLIFAGAGLGAGEPALGWSAAAMAVLTAYVRELGRACGAPPDFCGPMAKPHRMAALIAAAGVSVAEPWIAVEGRVLGLALWVVVAGSALTALRRAARLVARMTARAARGDGAPQDRSTSG